MTVVRGLCALAATLFLTGVALRLAPTPTPRPAAPPTPPAPAPRDSTAPAAIPAARYAAIVTTNVFSQDRAAPAVRFAPPGRVVAAPKPSGPGLRLYGITVAPQGAVALIAGAPRVPGAQIYRVGDLVGSARVVGITDSTVTLADRGGALVLRLKPAERRKS